MDSKWLIQEENNLVSHKIQQLPFNNPLISFPLPPAEEASLVDHDGQRGQRGPAAAQSGDDERFAQITDARLEHGLVAQDQCQFDGPQHHAGRGCGQEDGGAGQVPGQGVQGYHVGGEVCDGAQSGRGQGQLAEVSGAGAERGRGVARVAGGSRRDVAPVSVSSTQVSIK